MRSNIVAIKQNLQLSHLKLKPSRPLIILSLVAGVSAANEQFHEAEGKSPRGILFERLTELSLR